jgi:hypothetical protein
MKAMAMLGSVVMAMATLGCAGEPIHGSWENDEATGGFQDEMTIAEDGGSRELEFAYPLWCGDVAIAPRVTIELDVTWSGDADSGYEIEFECARASIAGEGGCEGVSGCDSVYELLGFSLDIESDCEVNDAEDELECEFEGEEFTFERTGE